LIAGQAACSYSWRLTTTSYAGLAALALREHSTYELAKQIRMGWRYFWPRAESNVYAEPKRLVAAGLAESRKESTGKRPRTVYAITDAGRAELAAWLASPSSPVGFVNSVVVISRGILSIGADKNAHGPGPSEQVIRESCLFG
jgi:DNA-binding PadR family transcriptional regulator